MTDDLAARVQNFIQALNTTRFAVLTVNEAQTRVLDVREVSVAEWIAILDSNGLIGKEEVDRH
jgi:hypothetical protein